MRRPDVGHAGLHQFDKFGANGLRRRSVAHQQAIERNDIHGNLFDGLFDGVEGTLGGGCDQAEHERGHRGDQPDRQLDGVLRGGFHMMLR